jgi:hypothetical protein
MHAASAPREAVFFNKYGRAGAQVNAQVVKKAGLL